MKNRTPKKKKKAGQKQPTRKRTVGQRARTVGSSTATRSRKTAPTVRSRRVGRWPSDELSVQRWLQAVQANRRYTIADLASITGATQTALRGILHRGGIPDRGAPSGYGTHHQLYWTSDRASVFLEWLGREVHLPDAFPEPMVRARDAADMLGINYASFRNSVSLGRLPRPAVEASGIRQALWRASDIETAMNG